MLLSALPMVVTSIGNVLLGLLGMKLVDVPMFFTLRRLVTPTIIVIEYISYGKVAKKHELVSVFLLTIGTIIAAAPTLSSDLVPYLVVLVTNMFTAANMTFQKQFRDELQVSVLTIVLINSILTLPVTLLLMLVSGELETLSQSPNLTSVPFWVVFIASATLGLVLTFAAMLNTTYNSPIATSITGNVKDIATTFLGWYLFPGFRVSVASVSGIFLSFCGAFWFSYSSLLITLSSTDSATTLTAGPKQLSITAS